MSEGVERQPRPPDALPRARRTRATVLFVDLVGFTALAESRGPERAYLLVTGCLRLLDGIARRHGGSVDKYQGDSMMAVFGHLLPLESPSRAALTAALEMRRVVREYACELNLAPVLDLHIGVNSGSVVAGDIRGHVIREFHMLGDAVNVAARLKARAPVGAIYAGPETRAEAGAAFVFAELEPLRLKGKAAPVAAWALEGARSVLWNRRLGADEAVPPPFLGRGAELERLRQIVRNLAHGRGGILTLVGEEGVGKSRLLGQLARDRVLDGVATLQITPSAERRPLEMASALADALNAAGGVSGLTPALGAAAAAHPLLVAFDDLDGVDPASAEVVAKLLPLADAQRLLFLLVASPDPPAPAAAVLAAARRSAGAAELVLGPLEVADARRLLASLAAEDGIDPRVAALIEARAAGNPGRLVRGVFLVPALAAEAEGATGVGGRSREAERRRATILFADITGFTAMTERLGAEAAYPAVAGCLALLDEIARKHGGTVEKYLGDCVMALFGVPEAIEDAPRAAVNAAIEMRRRVREYVRSQALPHPLDVHTGIHTGRSITGDVSGPLLREFAVMGEPVVVASELTHRAEAGEIFVGPETWRLTRERFAYAERGPLKVPGRGEPVLTYELLSEREQMHRDRLGAEREIVSSLVGRDTELSQLRRRMAELLAGRGSITALVGEAGLGKSRLAAEARREMEGKVAWLEARSLVVGHRLAFHPFADLLRSWCGVDDTDDEAGVARKLEAAVGRVLRAEAEEALPFVAGVMGLPLRPVWWERLESVRGDLRDRVMRARMLRLLQRVSEEQPLILVFEDLHWADLSSIELLESLQHLAVTHPIFFLHLFRPHFAATSGRILERARAEHGDRLEVIDLHPLGREAVRLLVNNLFRGADIPQRVRARISEQAGGNPFYIEEVARSLVEQGAMERRGGSFAPTERIHSVEIPGTIEEVVRARIDRLPLRQRELVQVASVIGRSFHLEVLQQIFPEKEELLEDLQCLRDGELIVPWERSQGTELAFKQPLVQEVAYDALLEQRREELHRRVAAAIEASFAPTFPGYAAMLAYHLGLGRELERAEEFLFRAGDEAARASASSEALHFFQEAARLYMALHGERAEPRKRAVLERSVGLAHHHRGQLIEAEQHFGAALRSLGERVPTGPAALALRLLRNALQLGTSLYVPEGLRRRRAARDLDRDVIQLMMFRAEAQTYVSPARFVLDSLDTLARLDRVDPRTVPRSGGFYAGTVGIFSYGGISFGVSRRFLEKAARWVRHDDPEDWLFFRMMNHLHHFLAGDWSDRHRIPDAELERGIECGMLWEVVTYLGLEAEQHLRRGDFAAARARLAWIDQLWELFAHDIAKTNHYWLPTCMALEQRRLADAVLASESYFDENPEDLLHILALSYKAHAQTLLGQRSAAEITLERAAAIVAQAKYPPPFHVSSFRTARLQLDLAHAEAALADGDAVGARSWRRQARSSARRARAAAAWVAYRRPEIDRLIGRLAWLEGRRERALADWRRSLEAARALGAVPEEARMAHEIGLRLRTAPAGARTLDNRDASAWLDAAGRLYARVGLDADRARLDAGAPP